MKIMCIVTVFFTFIYYHYSFRINNKSNLLAGSESVLDPKGEITLKWRVDYGARKIRFCLEFSKKAPTINWFALGFSDRGDLQNSDVCLVWTDYMGRDHFEDMHADDNGRLIKDVHQNCEGFYLDLKSRSVVFERDFDTCDDDDYLIEDGTVHVIWARGIDKLFSSKGLCISCTSPRDHGFIRVRLLTPPSSPQQPGRKLRITNDKLKVPGGDTTYWCKVVKLPDYVTEKEHHIIKFLTPWSSPQQPGHKLRITNKNLPEGNTTYWSKVVELPDYVTEKEHHIIKFESTITKGNEGLVHHMEVFYCDADPDREIPLYEGNCFSNTRPESTKLCSKVKAAWAMGAPPFSYPDEAGLPLGGPRANKYVMLEVHYNNPELRNDWVDSSGIVVHISANKRKYDAAIMELGLEYTDKMAIPGSQRTFPLTGHCVPQCTGVGLPEDGIIVFGSQLHTHLTGVAVWTRHYRRGAELPTLNRDKHYSTHFQEIRILHRPVKVLPGDYLETTCIYNTADKINATIGGHAITDEMCVNYMHYYPATELEVCKSAISNAALEDYFKFEKRWDNISIDFAAPPRANYLSIAPWTPLRVKALHMLYTESPISMQCNKSDGNRFQGDWEGILVPKIKLPLPEEPRICRSTFNTITN